MGTVELAPARRVSTVDHIAGELRAAIASGRLEPGAQLGEAELATRFGVSRGPLREAMQRLVSEGILHAIANRGVFVSRLTLADMIDVYRTRGTIEQAALDLILHDRRDAAHAALAASVEAMRTAAAAGDGAGVSDGDQAFHEALVEVAGSPRLARAMRTLLVETRLCLGELSSTYADLGTQVREHEELREAIRTEPPEHVTALLAAHLADATARLEVKRST
ncbi:GntR family transcriptional regulator [Pseudactinotalea sp. HY160]|uniref:GntR family transcriptional regulator n=1 Tax=Pseudactinotalea sp. HY160 TaxID=2654490 RepID=UPI00128E77D2|nr:GntR family transcriptional regulator [Pseudactinotalea sp. HY160]MPV50835.1 GntR family transcriptional regulator [Pseudactinotalea sp. HY160]